MAEKKIYEIGVKLEFAQSNIEGELVNLIQNSRPRASALNNR